MTGDDMEDPVFDRFDAAALLAVEGANGGEWAGLGQVLVTFHLLFGEWPEPEDFAGSCELLLAARLLTHENEGRAGPRGRKLLRRAGRHGSPSRPAKVAELLAFIDERDLADGSGGGGPSVEDVAAAREHLTEDVADDFAMLHASNEARLVGPPMVLPGGIGGGTGFDALPDLAVAGDGGEDEASVDDDEAPS